MRVLSMIAGACLMPFAAFAQAPDAAPSTPVETVELAAFEPTREEAVLDEEDVPGLVASLYQAMGAPVPPALRERLESLREREEGEGE